MTGVVEFLIAWNETTRYPQIYKVALRYID